MVAGPTANRKNKIGRGHMALAPQSSQTASDDDDGEGRGPLVSRPYMVAFILVASLFFMWAIANNFNDILIKQFQKALDLTRMQSGLVQTAFYFGYFTIALPAGWVMTKVGYKNGILIGLSGALFPPLMGLISDRARTIQASMVVLMVSLFTVLWFGRYMANQSKRSAH
jgi:fucose permease